MIVPFVLTLLFFYLVKKLKKENKPFFSPVLCGLFLVLLLLAGKKYLYLTVSDIKVCFLFCIGLFIFNLNRRFTTGAVSALVLFIMLFAGYLFNVYYKISSLFGNKVEYVRFYEDRYVPAINLQHSQRRNVILIFVESMNETYRQITVKGTYREMADEKAVRFDNFVEGYAQRWTQAALFSAFTGTHIHYISDYYRYMILDRMGTFKKDLRQNLAANGLSSGFDFKLPNINSLGKISKENGYQNLFMQGGSVSFSGTKSFLLHNGFEEKDIYGEENLEAVLGKKAYPSWLGYKDSDVLAAFKRKILGLDLTRPFLAVFFTTDLHVGNNPYFKTMEDIVDDTIKNLNDFMDWAAKQEFYNNTTVVVVGDHLRMGTESNDTHKIYNAFYNLPEDLANGLNVQRTFNQIDMFPTILEIMGYELPERKAGMGVSLFAGAKTLAEEFSLPEQNDIFEKIDKYYMRLWTKDKMF